jgi:TetR/AcrR family transcriptional regulator
MKQQWIDADAKKRLLKAAISLFTRRGYASTSVREIVEAAGVTKPVLYYYFRNKEAIYLQILQEALDEFKRFLEAPRPGKRVEERLKRFVLETNELFNEKMDVVRLIHSIFYGPPQGAPAFDYQAFHCLLHEAVLKLVREGTRAGNFACRKEENMTLAVMGAFNIVTESNLAGISKKLDGKDLANILDVVLAGMKSRKMEQVS